MRRAVFLAGAAGALWVPRVAAAQGVPLRLAATPDDQSSPLLWAQHAGLFERAGLAVELRAMASGAAVAAAVAGGSLQLGASSTMSLVSAHARGVPFVLVAPGFVYRSERANELLLVRKDSPIRTARDLNGKTIGSSALRDLLSTATLAWIDQNGGDAKSVRAVEVPTSASLAALEAGRIDAVTMPEPRLGAALRGGNVRVLGKSFDAIGKRFLVTSLFATREWASANAETVRRFARAVVEANRYANEHPTETAPLLAAFSGVPVETINASVRESYGDAFVPGELQRVVEAAVRYGVIERGFPAEEMLLRA